MPHQDQTPSRPTAAWISRYAAGLLSSRPELQPLDAVRLAMNAAAQREPLRAVGKPRDTRR